VGLAVLASLRVFLKHQRLLTRHLEVIATFQSYNPRMVVRNPQPRQLISLLQATSRTTVWLILQTTAAKVDFWKTWKKKQRWLNSPKWCGRLNACKKLRKPRLTTWTDQTTRCLKMRRTKKRKSKKRSVTLKCGDSNFLRTGWSRRLLSARRSLKTVSTESSWRQWTSQIRWSQRHTIRLFKTNSCSRTSVK